MIGRLSLLDIAFRSTGAHNLVHDGSRTDLIGSGCKDVDMGGLMVLGQGKSSFVQGGRYRYIKAQTLVKCVCTHTHTEYYMNGRENYVVKSRVLICVQIKQISTRRDLIG